MWYRGCPQNPSCTIERATPWRAPSWSWASLVGQVRFLDIPDELSNVTTFSRSFDRVTRAECCPKGKDPYGEISGGHITIISRLTKGLIKDGLRSLELETESEIVSQDEGNGSLIHFNLFSFDAHSESQPVGSVLYLLQLAEITLVPNPDYTEDGSDGVSDEDRRYEVSLLLKCIDSKSKTFERVGIIVRNGTLFTQEDEETITIA